MSQNRRVLVVEDERHIADVVEFALGEHGFEVRVAPDGDTGLREFRKWQPRLVILDLNLPGMPGLDLLGRMRAEQPDIPLVILSARTEEPDRVAGLEMGADDYVTKPFSPRELVARVRSVLRRADGVTGGDPAMLEIGPLRVWPDSFRVSYFEEDVALSRNEFRLIELLARHPARVYARDALIDAIHDGEGFVTDRSVDAQVKRVRQRLMSIRGSLDPIQAVYGIGYKLNQALEDAR
jgi:DNA-binding response OmpR family regulator